MPFVNFCPTGLLSADPWGFFVNSSNRIPFIGITPNPHGPWRAVLTHFFVMLLLTTAINGHGEAPIATVHKNDDPKRGTNDKQTN